MQNENTTAIAKLEGRNKRPGYKNPTLVLIPEDRNIKTFGEIGVFSKGKNINHSELKQLQ